MLLAAIFAMLLIMRLAAVFASYTMIGGFIQIFLIIGLALFGIKFLHRGGFF